MVYVAKSGEVYQPRTGKKMAPRPLGDAPVDDPVDRRRALANWLTAENRRWLARNVVNRYWGYLLGKGLVNPIDDLRETNPPSNPELLDALADAFIASGYDLKAPAPLDPHQPGLPVECLATPENRLDTTFFTHYTIKRLTAEQLLDAIDAATGTVEKFPELARRHPCDLGARHELRFVLPRHVRPAAASDRLRMRAIERPQPEPGPAT